MLILLCLILEVKVALFVVHCIPFQQSLAILVLLRFEGKQKQKQNMGLKCHTSHRKITRTWENVVKLGPGPIVFCGQGP